MRSTSVGSAAAKASAVSATVTTSVGSPPASRTSIDRRVELESGIMPGESGSPGRASSDPVATTPTRGLRTTATRP